MKIPFDSSDAPTDYGCDYVQKKISKVLDWNLEQMTVLNYRVTDDHRLQVALMDHDADRIDGTRNYMERLIPSIINARLDLIVIHAAP